MKPQNIIKGGDHVSLNNIGLDVLNNANEKVYFDEFIRTYILEVICGLHNC